MSDVVSFRASQEELDLIEATRVKRGLPSRAEAVRFLIDQAARQARPTIEEPVFQFRVAAGERDQADVTSRSIDDELYGEDA